MSEETIGLRSWDCALKSERKKKGMTTFPHHIVTPAGTGKLFRALNEIVEFKVTSSQSGGAYLVVQVATAPQGGATLMHTHKPQETFYILEGHYEFGGIGENGPYTIQATTGASVEVPSNAPHLYKNVGTTIGRLLLVYDHPNIMEPFFEEVGDPTTQPELIEYDDAEIARILAIGEKYGMVFLRPSEG
jgi:quercetin dioxygenase-like cupin family protein